MASEHEPKTAVVLCRSRMHASLKCNYQFLLAGSIAGERAGQPVGSSHRVFAGIIFSTIIGVRIKNASVDFEFARTSVYGLLLIASTLLMADMARLHTYIRPLKLAYVDAGP